MNTGPCTLFDKIWESHVVGNQSDGDAHLYIDLHLLHEVTSPQAFSGLLQAGRKVRRVDLTLATVDHNVPTKDVEKPWVDREAIHQVETLRKNAKANGIPLFDIGDPRQGIVHVVGPEQGLTQPGMTIVCGDSHTSTHGAFGALAFGIGTSEVEHVLASQTLLQKRPRTMAVEVLGTLPQNVSAKDLVLAIIRTIGVAGGTGHVIEYRGSAIRALSMEGRMTICNMSIEAGARAGLIAPDNVTYGYLEGRPFAPRGKEWQEALARWKTFTTDEGASFDRVVTLHADSITPQVTWGTNPGQTISINEPIPDPDLQGDGARTAHRALEYMGLKPGQRMTDISIDRVFVGSCTNARIEDLRAVAKVVRGRKVAAGVHAMVVPGSGLVKAQAEAEGLSKIFQESGFEWRSPGCSMCLGMNPDVLSPKERCASTSNRNFEGRQGPLGRTHLVSPETAAATAIVGRFADPRKFL